jgi:hypothetical protein
VWNSGQNATADSLGAFVKFVNPTVDASTTLINTTISRPNQKLFSVLTLYS